MELISFLIFSGLLLFLFYGVWDSSYKAVDGWDFSGVEKVQQVVLFSFWLCAPMALAIAWNINQYIFSDARLSWETLFYWAAYTLALLVGAFISYFHFAKKNEQGGDWKEPDAAPEGFEPQHELTPFMAATCWENVEHKGNRVAKELIVFENKGFSDDPEFGTLYYVTCQPEKGYRFHSETWETFEDEYHFKRVNTLIRETKYLGTVEELSSEWVCLGVTEEEWLAKQQSTEE